MEINSKELVNGVMNALNEDGAFDSPFLSKGKFKLILSKNISNSTNPIDEMEDIVDKTIKECVLTAVDDTLETLSEDGLVESVVKDNGEIAYRLKQ